MSNIAIRVENCILTRVEELSKLYHIGRAQQRHDTLRDAISDFRLRISDSLRSASPAARDARNPQSTVRNPQFPRSSPASPSRPAAAPRSTAASAPCWRWAPARKASQS